METTDELSPQPVTASPPPPPPNPSHARNPSSDLNAVAREEGELSSDGDRECPNHSASPSAGTAAPSPCAGSDHAPPENGLRQANQPAKAIRGNVQVSSVSIDVLAPLQQKHEKTSVTNQLPPKTVTSRIITQQNNSNLVISFSDDESSSDSDGDKQPKVKTVGSHGNKKTATLTTEGQKKNGKAPRNVNLNMSKGPSIRRTFIPSAIKNRGVNISGDNLLSGVLRSNSRNNIVNKTMEGQDLGSGFGLKNIELRDLRHQIALRESELKLRSTQLNKPSASGACGDPEALNSSRDSIRRPILKSADVSQLGPKEPPSKRLKVGAPSYAGKSLGQERPAARSLSPPKALMFGSSKISKVNHVREAPSAGPAKSGIVRWKRQDGESKKDGSMNGDGGQHYLPSKMAYTALLPGHNVPADIMAPNASTENLGTPLTASLWSSLYNANASKQGSREIQTLIEMEDSLDKELADAQQHRRMCEIEERNALKAYHKAQRALLEANAGCAHLYQQRELYSSRLRSCIMDDSGLLGCSSGHDYSGVQFKSSNEVSENVDLMPSLSQQMQAEDDQFNGPVYTSNVQCTNGLTLDSSYQPINGQSLGSEPCSEPDGSTSEPLPHRDNNLVPGESSSNEQTISIDEDEDIPPDSRHSYHGYHRDRRKFEEKNTDDESLRLEATLRSELFAKLGGRARNSKGSNSNMMPMVEKISRSNVGSGKTDGSNERGLLTDAERLQRSDFDGNKNQEGGLDNAPVLDVGKTSLDQGASHDYNDNRSSLKESQNVASVISLSTFSSRSAFHHLKVITSLRIESHQQNDDPDVVTIIAGSRGSSEIEWTTSISNSSNEIDMDLREGEASSYSSDVAMDPFWPLCMFELRGKCNNDECPWQHVKDYSVGKMARDVHVDPDEADCQVALTPNRQCCSATPNHLKYLAPTYLVGLDILKADFLSYDSVVAQRVGQSWQKCFSISLAISGFFKQVLNADDSILQNNDGRVEVIECWSSHPSYLRNRNCRLNDLKQASVGNSQTLETALLLFNQATDKYEAKLKALSVLARALEASPTSVVMWIAYLVLYYIKTEPVGKDDLYSHAVKHNRGSYELWLTYINSRTKLNDRFAAYEEALSALRDHSSVSHDETSQTSSCILDLVLQMIHCYCMSGNTDKAAHLISDLLSLAEKSDERFSSLLSNILSSCLTISDKCIFWICCVYLVIYRKLPDAIVHQLECDKDVLLIEWPPAHLTDEERRKVTEVVEFAVSEFGSSIGDEPDEHIRLAQNFALSHIRCNVALDGLERSRGLLDRYAKMYPACLDLALMSARVENYDFEGLSFHGFENALSKWPKGADGFQYIWYQYAEYVLERGKADFATELMNRWYSSVWDIRHPEPDMDQIDTTSLGGDSCGPVPVYHSGISASHTSELDEVYSLLNLSLHKLLQKQHEEAREAINQALKAADHVSYALCLREHVVFMLTNESLMKDCSQISGILNLLGGYLNDPRAYPLKEPLSRKFIEDVDNPRVRKLIKSILCPFSTNFLLVNSVLDSLFGPGLLPHKFRKPKDLVDFVEAILEISPANYPLAISLCKRIIGEDQDFEAAAGASDFTGVSFWAGSVLVSTLSHAVPIAPESVWVDSAMLLRNTAGSAAISEGFFRRALSVYPFSVNLWKTYYDTANSTGDGEPVLEAANEKGIELDHT